MTLSAWSLFSLVLVPLVLGAGLLRLQGIARRSDPLAFLGWAWMQGSFGLAVVLSAWLWLELPLRAGWIAPVVLALGAAAFLFGRRVPAVEPAPSRSFPRWERVVFALVLAALLVTTLDRILLAARDVIAGLDEGLIWAAKAKVMFHTGGFGPAFREQLAIPNLVGHQDYPPLNPLLQLWVHVQAGEIVHVESRLPVQLFAFAGLFVTASAARRRLRPLVAALFLVCISTIGLFFTYQVFSELLVATALFAFWDLWLRYQEDGERAWLRLFGVTAAVLVWSKNEGALHVLAFAVALLAAAWLGRVRLPERGTRARALAWGLPLAGSVLYIAWFNWHFRLLNDLLDAQARDLAAAEDLPRFLGDALVQAAGAVPPIVAKFADLIVTEPVQTHFLFLAVLVVLVLDRRSAAEDGRLVFTLGLLLALLGYMTVYLRTPWELQNHLDHSASRLLYHLSPSAGLWVLSYVAGALPRLAASPLDVADAPDPGRSFASGGPAGENPRPG